MHITVNGRTREIESGQTLRGLILAMDLDPSVVVDELNQDIEPCEKIASTSLGHGGRLELPAGADLATQISYNHMETGGWAGNHYEGLPQQRQHPRRMGQRDDGHQQRPAQQGAQQGLVGALHAIF